MAVRLLVVLLGCLFLFQLLEFVQSKNTCESHDDCQNGGKCVEQNSTLECLCSCNYTGKHCETKDWCRDAKFSQVGCFIRRNDNLSLFNADSSFSSPSDSVWNWFLDNTTCSCALAAKKKGLRFFSLGENGLCAGYSSDVFSSMEEKPEECLGKAPHKDKCNDNNTLTACVGSAGHEYAYELSEIDEKGECVISDTEECDDFDYVVRFKSTDITEYFGPILNGLPSGQPFSVCVWQKIVGKVGRKQFIVSYSIPSNANHFLFGLVVKSATSFQMVYYINGVGYFSSFMRENVIQRWVYLCSTPNFPERSVITYIDGEVLNTVWNSRWNPLTTSGLTHNGYLIIGRDQDRYWGRFQTTDTYLGEITQFNVWDILLNQNEIQHLANGVGTETGNFLSWTTMKKYLHGPVLVHGSPVIKWTGKGCELENWQCNDKGVCQGAHFHCPCNNSVLAPRSCRGSSTVYKTKPCSDHDYVLEFSSPSWSPANLILGEETLHYSSTLSICTWLKVPPGFANSYELITMMNTKSSKVTFRLVLINDLKLFTLEHIDSQSWSLNEEIANNIWRHICVIKIGSSVKLYHNGVSLGTKSFSNSNVISGNIITLIGNRKDEKKYSFTGSIAHFNIWNTALSDTQVSSLANGAGTEVGNLLSWPSVRQNAPDTIRAVPSSPIMKWTNKCNWTDNSCDKSRRCEGATLICPAVYNVDVAPESCVADSSYLSIEKMRRTNWKNDVIDVVLVSRGYNDNPKINHASLFINDVEQKAMRQGMHLHAFNAKTGKFRRDVYCSTGAVCVDSMTKFFRGFVDEVIVLGMVFNSYFEKYESIVPPLKLALGKSVYIRSNIYNFGAVTIIGFQGNKDVSWGYFKVSDNGKGPTITRTTIPLVRDSCLDHLYMGAREDGQYIIYPENGPEMTVFCEFTTNGGGWTVFQRRHKGAESFTRSLQQYESGFGQVRGEFWLGNEKLYRLGGGQLFARLASSDKTTYALYNTFSLSSDYTLFADGCSGLISDGVFGANSSRGLLFGNYNKSNEADNKCFSKTDGGWWLGESCDGMNLNAEKKICNSPFLTSETMIRPRPTSSDVVMKIMHDTISYLDAMEICKTDGKRLCTANEICADGTTPIGGVFRGEYWTPVFDTYNQWLQIGEHNTFKICTFVTSYDNGFPAWGESNIKLNFKGKMFCCGTSFTKTMIRKYLGGSITYSSGEEACRKYNKRLCNSGEIVPRKESQPEGIIFGDAWVPIADRDDFWLFVGKDVHPFGTRLHKVDWNSVYLPYKGHLFCCDFPKANGIIKRTMSHTTSYAGAKEICKMMGKRLCSLSELCVDGRTPYGGIIPGNKWTPVANRDNEWVFIGNDAHTCMIHSIKYGVPIWGATNSHTTVKENLFCCDLPKARGITTKEMGNTVSYQEAAHGCWEENKRLCSQKEICADGLVPYGGPFDGEHWTPTIDTFNEWISVGNVQPPCITHTYKYFRRPAWGKTNQQRYHKGKVFCCDPIRRASVQRSWKYDLRFYGNEGHVRYPRISPLKAFSICWWISTNAIFEGWKTLFSHWSLDKSKQFFEFSINSHGGYQFTLAGDTRESEFPQLFYDKSVYHHFCISWSMSSGSAKIYKDGSLVDLFNNLDIEEPFSDGSLVIGQTLASNSTFDLKRSFHGVLTRFNLWDRELTAGTIDKFSTVCGEEEGTIIAWPEMKLWISDEVGVEESEACFPRNCLDYLYRNKKADGIYRVKPDRDLAFSVLCDQTTAGGGWTVIAKRFRGWHFFHYKLWKDYKNGFGSFSNDFWLGNEKIHRLTSVRNEELFLSGNDQNTHFAVTYERFHLESERTNYAMFYQHPFPEQDDKFEVGKGFFTKDHDTDSQCAKNNGPYWRSTENNCLKSNLFGTWNNSGNMGAQWYGKGKKLKSLEMKIRPREEFKSPMPVLYELNKNLTWSSSRDFCQSKNSDLCSSSDICPKYPFGGRKTHVKEVPVRDGYGWFTSLRDSDYCQTKNKGTSGTTPIEQSYKGFVFCCQGFPGRDWRYDVRFQSNGHIDIKMPKMSRFSVCWWMRVSRFITSWSTVFSFVNQKLLFHFKHQDNGQVQIKVGSNVLRQTYSSIVDGNWHHYCLQKNSLAKTVEYFYDGNYEPSMSNLLPQVWKTVLDGGALTIGQHVFPNGNIGANQPMVGELSRFNWWHREFLHEEIKRMSLKCSGETGDVLAWPQLKYWIVKGVEVLESTTCNKPDAYHWSLDKVEGNEYGEAFNDYNAKIVSETQVESPDRALTLAGNAEYVRTEDFLDDCIANPSLCEESGFTVAMWLKRKGLVSSLLPETDKNYETLLKWLDDAAGGVSSWLPCYTGAGIDLNLTAFHIECDYQGATATLVKVGGHVFGGFSNENWGGPSTFISSHSSFLFSLYNPDGLGPVKMNVRDGLSDSALFTNDVNGPSFGEADLKIGACDDNEPGVCCSSVLGKTYNLPPGYDQGTDKAKYFLTSQKDSTIDHLEVFYANVPSEPVGIDDSNVIKDAQMSSSSVRPSTYAPHNARLNNANMWYTAAGDMSPWLQVKLPDVMWIKKITTQFCTEDVFSKTFTMSFSMDGISWTPYREDLTHKVFFASKTAQLFEVMENTLKHAVETRYTRINIVGKNTSSPYACIRIELYSVVQVCPSSSLKSPCPVLTSNQVECEIAGCCYNQSCFAKIDIFTAIGMESKDVPDESITASSWRDNHAPYFARFNVEFAGWAPSMNLPDDWLQVELNKVEVLTHIATKGILQAGVYSYCKSYMLRYRTSSQDDYVVYKENGKDRIFRGYPNHTKIIKIMFLEHFRARFVRLYPQVGGAGETIGIIRIELYRTLNNFGTTIISTDADTVGGTGISFSHRNILQYRFAVKSDISTWELILGWIPYRWTHITFTWSKRWGIQHFQDGMWMSESRNSRPKKELIFSHSNSLNFGRHYPFSGTDIVHQVFTLRDLFVVKRQLLPSEVKSFIYKVPCSFGIDEPLCSWENGNWSDTALDTSSVNTGPKKGLEIKGLFNLAFLHPTSQSSTYVNHSGSFNSSFGVDGKVNEHSSSPLHTCAMTQPSVASWWQVDLGDLKHVGVVTLFQDEGFDANRMINYEVTISPPMGVNYMCTNYENKSDSRSYACDTNQEVQNVRITTTVTSQPLFLCEVAVYSLENEEFVYLESSYPLKKGFSGRLTSRCILSRYNCLHFYYHMHGDHMGRLNVFVQRVKHNDTELLWRLVGNQGNEWRAATAKIEQKGSELHQIIFEGVVGDGYLSDIAVDNVIFTVDGQCQTTPPQAKVTFKVMQKFTKCLCISKVGSSAILSKCNSSSSGFEWLENGIIKQNGKCLRPQTNVVMDGTVLVFDNLCDQTNGTFEFTFHGAIRHRKSLLCVQPARWTGLHKNDELVLGREGCEYWLWSYAKTLFKGPHDIGYLTQEVIKFGLDDLLSCSEDNLLPFIPNDLQTIHANTRLYALEKNTMRFLPATVDKIEKNRNLTVSFNGSSDTVVVKWKDVSLMPNQPLRGSAILNSFIPYTSILAKWLAATGVFVPFWKPCIYLTRDGVSNFTCAVNPNVPTLVVIRRGRKIIGGFLSQKVEGEKKTGNFLFSFKQGSVFNKFDDVTNTTAPPSAFMNEGGMGFGDRNEELSVTWSGVISVVTNPGASFKVPDLTSMAGKKRFTAHDFEVLQPRDEVCIHRCKSNTTCDEITGKCICDYTKRPPAWCLTGSPNETIYVDAVHYWSMDSLTNIIDHKTNTLSWGIVQGEIHGNEGVNAQSVELKNGDGKLELLRNEFCLSYPHACGRTGITISLWFKSIERENSNIQDRVFFQTSTVDGETGFFMMQGDTRGEIIFQERRAAGSCQYNVFTEPNLWSFYTFTYQRDVDGFRVTRNSVPATNKTCSSAVGHVVSTKGVLVLGNGGNVCSALFDDVAMWHRKLGEEEIQRMYKYYYKEPPRLDVKLQVTFPKVSWIDDLQDIEKEAFVNLQNTIVNSFDALFPGHDNKSFVSIDKCRMTLIGAQKVVCEINLHFNGSDYEMIKILNDESVIEKFNMSISKIITTHVTYEAPIFDASSFEPTKIRVEWNAPNVTNLYQGVVIVYSTNKTNETFNVTVNTAQSVYNLTNLIGFSYYEIKLAVYTLAGLGYWCEPITVLTIEDVPKFSPGNLTANNVSSTELTFQWDAVQGEDTYEALRGYVAYITEADNPNVVIKNITTNASTVFIKIDDLKKFTVYTLYIQAYTVDLGVKSLTVNVSTAEDAPDAPPSNFTVFDSSSSSLRLEFKPVPTKLLNGILRGYRVFFFKTREGNHTRKNFTIEKEENMAARRRKRSVDEYYQDYPLFANIYGLEEYTNYTIQIQAITIKNGVLAKPFTTLTSEDLSSSPPPNVTARNTSATSILLEWDLLPESERNGVILGYVVYYNRSGNETMFVHRNSSPSVEMKGLEKFTIYWFEITAFNSIGQSNRSTIVYCKSDQGKPDAPPQDINGIPTSGITMACIWKPVPFELRRGIILGYRFVFSSISGKILASRTFPPHVFFTSVTDLMLFTNYTVNMTAFTIKGDGPWESKVVLSLQLAPDIAPLNLSSKSHVSLSDIPILWTPVPPEKTQGYIIGYNIHVKLVSIGLENVGDAKEKVFSIHGPAHSSYLIQGLDYFAKYKIYLVAYTVGGNSPRSDVIYEETCRCHPTLNTQWRNIAPYTNITTTGDSSSETIKNSWGIFPYIINDAVDFCCQTCSAHGPSTVDFSKNEHNQHSEVFSNAKLIDNIDGQTDLTFPVYGYLGMTVYHHQYMYTPLVESPGSAFVVKKEKSTMGSLLMSNIIGNWPLLVIMVCLALAAGAVMWILEQRVNPEEFPPNVIKGIANGFWWAYISMTTVGYGDRSPRSIPGRIFAIMWTLTGLVITAILVGDLASSLTLSVSDVEKMIYGAQVGAIELSPEFGLGIRLNARMNTATSYGSLDDLQKGLLRGEVDGILLDAYVVGSRKDLFGRSDLLVNRIKDYRAAYGIVWAGKSSRMRVCLEWYMKAKKEKMFTHIVENLVMAKKMESVDVSEEMANLFDPTAEIYTKTVFLCLILLGTGVVCGLTYELIRRRCNARRVKPQRMSERQNTQQCIEGMQQFLQKSFGEIHDELKAVKRRHIKQIKQFDFNEQNNSLKFFRKRKIQPIST